VKPKLVGRTEVFQKVMIGWDGAQLKLGPEVIKKMQVNVTFCLAMISTTTPLAILGNIFSKKKFRQPMV
jgi:hypothetical protein